MDIEKSTFIHADDDTKAEITFDLLTSIHKNIGELKVCYEEHLGVCHGRFEKLENRKKIDTVTSAGAGLIGGFLAQITGWFK